MKQANKLSLRGKKIYLKIKSNLEKRFKKSDYVTIETETGKYFIGKTPIEAIDKAQKEFPKKRFFLAQVGRAAGNFFIFN